MARAMIIMTSRSMLGAYRRFWKPTASGKQRGQTKI